MTLGELAVGGEDADAGYRSREEWAGAERTLGTSLLSPEAYKNMDMFADAEMNAVYLRPTEKPGLKKNAHVAPAAM